MPANLKARAKRPGACAMKGCVMAGDKIYEGDGLRLLACTQGHADAVLRKLSVPPKGMDMATYRRLRDDALRIFNERPATPVTVTPAASEHDDDYDIDF